MLIPTTILTSSGGSGMTLIDDQLLGANAADITVSSIPGTYRSLVIYAMLRAADVVGTRTLQVQFNGDTGSNYWYVYQDLIGAGNIAVQSAAASTSMQLGLPVGSSFASGVFSPFTFEIPFYASTTFHKSILSRSFLTAESGSNNYNGEAGGNWTSTAAVTSIKYFLDTGNFLSGSRVATYGLL